MVDRQLIKRILGQRNLAQSLIARHQLGVSGEMPGHPAFVAPLAVVAAPDARPAPLFEQTPLDDAALASFFAAPDAQRAPLPEMRLQPAPVAPAVTDEGAEIGALPAAAPNPPNRLDQQDVRPPHQPQSQMGRQVAEQAAAPPDTRAEPRPHASSERHDTGAAAQAHQPAFVTAEMLQPAEMPQSAALPQVRPPAQAAPETVIAQQAGTAIPTKIAELLARESPPAPQDRPQPALAAPASGDPYIDMVNKVRAARIPKGPAPRPRVPLGQRLNEARDFDSPVDLNQAVSHELQEQPGVPVSAQPTIADKSGMQPWDDPKQAAPPAAQPAPGIHPQAVEETQPALPLPRPEAGTNAAVPTEVVSPDRAAEPAHLPDPVVQAERAAIAQQAEPAPRLAQATTPAAPAVAARPDAGQVAASEDVPIPAQPVDHAGDVRLVQRQAQAERAQAEQPPLPAETAAAQAVASPDAALAPLPNELRDLSIPQGATPAQPPAFPPAPADIPQPAPQAKLAVAPETGSLAGQPGASQPQEQSSERAGMPRPIEAQSGQKIDEQGARMPAEQPGTPRAEAPRIEQPDHIDPSQVESGVQPSQKRQPGQPASRADMAANDSGVRDVPIVAPDTYIQQSEQREAPNEPVAPPAARRAYAPPARPDQPAASAASDQTIAPEQAPVRVPASDSAVPPAARPQSSQRVAAQPEGAVQPAPAGTAAAWAARLRGHEQANAPQAPAPVELVAGLPQVTAPEAPVPATPTAGLPGAAQQIQQSGSANTQPQASAPVRTAVDAWQAQPEVSAPAAGTAAAWAARLRRHEQATAPQASAPVEPVAGLPQVAHNQQQPVSANMQPEVSAPAAAWAARLRRHETMQQPQLNDRTAVQLAEAPATPAAQLQQNEQGTPMPPPGSITPSRDVSQPARQSQSPARPQTPIAQAPMRESTRRFLKPIIGRDPADVPVYRGAAADQLAARYAADALTDGAAVVLAADESETTPRALGVLAHELAHVEQAARFIAPHTATERAAQERAARLVEAQAVRQARAEREQVWQASPAASPVAARPVAAVPQAGRPAPGEQWNGLPAPWEPLPDDVFASQQPAFVPETRATPAAQRSPSPAPLTARGQAALSGAARPGASPEPMLAEHSRIQPSESATEPAQQDAPPAPEPDLDLLARQVYQVIKQRLAAERRRGRS